MEINLGSEGKLGCLRRVEPPSRKFRQTPVENLELFALFGEGAGGGCLCHGS